MEEDMAPHKQQVEKLVKQQVEVEKQKERAKRDIDDGIKELDEELPARREDY